MSELTIENGAITFKEITDFGLILIKANFKDVKIKKALKALSLKFPVKGKIYISKNLSGAWMAPDEMALMTPYKSANIQTEKIKRNLKGIASLCANMSDSRRSFVLSGKGWRDVLATGTPIDLSAETFSLGDFRRTRIGGLAVAIWMVDDFVVQIMCMTSVGDFFESWLRNAVSHVDTQKYF